MKRRCRARSVIVGTIALALVTGCSTGGGTGGGGDGGEGFPSGRIELIVWSEAGGSGDVNARQLAPLLEDDLGANVIVSNMAGGGGVEAVNYMLSQPEDGLTLVSVSGTLATLPGEEGVGFTLPEIQPLVQTEIKSFAIYVGADSPYQTIEDLMKADVPADQLRVTGVFPVGGYRFAWERFAEAAGIDSTWIPFDGAPEAIAAVAGGIAEVGVGYAGNLQPQVDAGAIRILAVESQDRLDQFPDVPTLAESGIDVVYSGYNGIIAKAGTPQAVTDRLLEAFKSAMASPKWADYLEGVQAKAGTTDPAEYQSVLDADAKFSAELKKKLGLV